MKRWPIALVTLLILLPLTFSNWNATGQADAEATPYWQASTSSIPLATNTVTISSTRGWQRTPLALTRGNQFTISYTFGTWSVDYRNLPYVTPEGYPPKIDRQIYQGCKTVSSLPYATLLGKIGNGPLFPVRRGGAFTADSSGPLYLRINDNEACFVDNDGSTALLVSLFPSALVSDRKNTTTGGDVIFVDRAKRQVVVKVIKSSGQPVANANVVFMANSSHAWAFLIDPKYLPAWGEVAYPAAADNARPHRTSYQGCTSCYDSMGCLAIY